MSTPFTTPSTGGKACNLTVINELLTAYNERYSAITALGVTPSESRSAGADALANADIATLQDFLEMICVYFVDHVSGPLLPDGSAFLMFTLSTWRSAAGLNASGFRRSIDGSTMLYGHIQASDFRGPWCIEDLQKGFSALRWSLAWMEFGNNWVNPDPSDLNKAFNALPSAVSWEDAKTLLAVLPTPIHLEESPSVYSYGFYSSDDLAWYATKLLEGSYCRATGQWNGRPKDASCWVKMTGPGEAEGVFYDCGLGYLEDQFVQVDELLANSDSTITTTVKVGLDATQGNWDAIPWGPDPQGFPPDYKYWCISYVDDSKWLLKWDFSNI